MTQACRPAGRLLYLVLAVVVMAASFRVEAREEPSAEPEPASSPAAEPRVA